MKHPVAVRLTVAAGLVLAGLVLGAAGWLLSQPAAPPAGAGSRPPSAPARPTGRALPEVGYSRPVQVSIPAIGVRASVVALGENPDGTVAVPPLSEPSLVSWFDRGPTPGQLGPAALYGHVAVAATGPAVFYRLNTLAPGDTVQVTRANHQVAVFRIYRIATYRKDAFPTRTVYGPTSGAQLRLITCGGPFDAATGSYLDNIVAFARLSAVR
ncbi:MAG TPA: class F sortase [Streptosporangiaceae bacterium]|nr:class F sortase [Streptosporangiaceae bacterium]